MSQIPMVHRTDSTPPRFHMLDAGETEITSPRRSTMELTGIVWMSWIVLKLNQFKGIKGYCSKHG